MKLIADLTSLRFSAGNRISKSAIAALAAGAMLLGTVAPVSALTFKEVIEYKVHALQCTLLLITDPIAHLVVCGEGDTSNVGTLSPFSYGPAKKEECIYDGDTSYCSPT